MDTKGGQGVFAFLGVFGLPEILRAGLGGRENGDWV